MELFGIGPLELLLVFVLALIFIGPGKMPEVAASLGKALREFRAASAELTDALNAEIAEAERKKTAVAASENGNGHSDADAAQAEIVAQGEIDGPAAVEFASPETPLYQYEETDVAPTPAASIEDVLASIARQELEVAAEREAEEAARLAAIAAERAILIGMGPLPESLLLPSSDAPLTVENPTVEPAPVAEADADVPGDADIVEPLAAETAEAGAAESDEESAAVELAELGEETAAAEYVSPNGEMHQTAGASESAQPNWALDKAETESLEATGASQAEVH